MGKYTTKGLYNKYDKNHKERSKTDYYATPPEETTNILKNLGINFSESIILEPCAGGGHMLQGIINYFMSSNCTNVGVFATDLHKHETINDYLIHTGEEFDFLSDEYKLLSERTDWIIMNPPYATIEPFTIRALEIAERGVIMLARLQFLEGEKRYTSILKENPPTDVYVYVDRIQCWKDGQEPEGSSAQAYAWFVWDKNLRLSNKNYGTQIHWLRRADKCEA